MNIITEMRSLNVILSLSLSTLVRSAVLSDLHSYLELGSTSEVDSFEMHIREKIDSSVYSSDTMKNLLRISLIHLVGKYNIYVKCWMLNPDFV